jgi:SAM-dependent methyltransferase
MGNAVVRSRFQGVTNIIRFNWPFYVWALGLLAALLLATAFTEGRSRMVSLVLLIVMMVPIVVSLAVSWYVYDLSGLYEMKWLDGLDAKRIVNVNAGFDETSAIVKQRYPEADLVVLDFYDAAKHTAPSIKRARNAYAPFPGTHTVNTRHLPVDDTFADTVLAIMSAHEIRQRDERAAFFVELRRILMPDGQIVVVEHLCDAVNLMAYNVGAFHFHSRATWLETFRAADLHIERETKIDPFVTAFFLKSHGTQS